MDNYTHQVKRLVRLLLFALAFAVLGWGFSSTPALYVGLALGLLVGLLNAVYTAYKVHAVGEAITKGKRKYGLGMVTRFALAALGVLIVLRYPDLFDIVGYVIGLLLMPVFALGDAIYLQYKQGRARERGE